MMFLTYKLQLVPYIGSKENWGNSMPKLDDQKYGQNQEKKIQAGLTSRCCNFHAEMLEIYICFLFLIS